VNQDLTREKHNITITSPDGGSFVLKYKNPKDNTIWTSSSLSTNCSAWDLQVALGGYYWNVWGAPNSVVKTIYDVNGTVTSNMNLAATIVFTVTIGRSLPLASSSLMTATRSSTKSSIVITPPSAYQLSNVPMTGSFRIQCTLKDGTTNVT
jgi:hypothetical protein